MKKIFPYSKQFIDKSDIKNVVNVLKSKFLTQGPKVERLENKIKNKVKSKYAIAMSSATAGLHLACLALNLKKGDNLWTVPNSFVASANCGLYCGAKIDFIDINSETFNIDVELLKKKLILAKKKKKLPKILVVVHMAGSPANLNILKKLSLIYKFKIIEDASHALGAKFNKIPIGSCRWSDLTVFSLHPVKIITAGEGGIITTNSKDLMQKILLLRNHGIVRDKNNLTQKKWGYWYYEQKLLGYNYRLSDIHCSLAISQIDKLDKFVKKRNAIANYYKKILKNQNLSFQKILKNCYSSYHLFIIQFKKMKTKQAYNKLFYELRKNKIMVNLHYLPIHLQPLYRRMGFRMSQFMRSEDYATNSFSIPIYPQLKVTLYQLKVGPLLANLKRVPAELI